MCNMMIIGKGYCFHNFIQKPYFCELRALYVLCITYEQVCYVSCLACSALFG